MSIWDTHYLKAIRYAANNSILSQEFTKVTDRLWDVEDIVKLLN